MSMPPFFFETPSRVLDQHFGLALDPEDILSALASIPRMSSHYIRPWRSMDRSTARYDSGSKVTMDKEKFQVALDVQQFTPDEISVKTVGSEIIVEGKHEEKEDEHGYISRHFVRKYRIPENHKPEDVVSSLSSDGVLSITAPRHRSGELEGERVVPITATGQAHKQIPNNTAATPNLIAQGIIRV